MNWKNIVKADVKLDERKLEGDLNEVWRAIAENKSMLKDLMKSKSGVSEASKNYIKVKLPLLQKAQDILIQTLKDMDLYFEQEIRESMYDTERE
tara:strand:+ start:348 stop:629 length:282 start_codon:yes stop_codon:yes gene_type:complete